MHVTLALRATSYRQPAIDRRFPPRFVNIECIPNIVLDLGSERALIAAISIKPMIAPQCIKNFLHRKRSKLQRYVGATGVPRTRMYRVRYAPGNKRRTRISLNDTRHPSSKPLQCPKIFPQVRPYINGFARARRPETGVQIEHGKMLNLLGQKLREDRLKRLVGPSLASTSEKQAFRTCVLTTLYNGLKRCKAMLLDILLYLRVGILRAGPSQSLGTNHS
jgi:hypothetical protein